MRKRTLNNLTKKEEVFDSEDFMDNTMVTDVKNIDFEKVRQILKG